MKNKTPDIFFFKIWPSEYNQRCILKLSFRRQIFFLQNLLPFENGTFGCNFWSQSTNSLFYSFFSNFWQKIRIFYAFLNILSNFCIICLYYFEHIFEKNKITLKKQPKDSPLNCIKHNFRLESPFIKIHIPKCSIFRSFL